MCICPGLLCTYTCIPIFHVHGCSLPQVWSVLDGTQLDEYIFHSDHVNCVLYSPTQPHILSAADNGIIKVSSFIMDVTNPSIICLDKTIDG